MMLFLTLLSCLGVIHGGPAPLHHAVHNERSAERVVGGNDARPNYWRWQVSLQFSYEDNETYFYHTCGGTLISPTFVMTAAHCILNPQGTNYRVALGDYNLFEYEGSEIFIPVKKIVLHPKWTGDLGNGFDIALLMLASPAYDNGFIEMANLPAFDQSLPHGFPCYITGWGLTQSGGSVPAILQEAVLPVVQHSVCSSNEWWGGLAKKSMICAGGDGYLAGCQGDSGGPLSCFTDGTWKVYGVVSYGPAGMCNTYRKPTVFTRVSSYVDWIFSVSFDSFCHNTHLCFSRKTNTHTRKNTTVLSESVEEYN
ncbi:elastase-1-like [Amia ocellicauda]|uniref:elastase-1-like n=1 Tax=Amia ocellicauda TaxID=2972642 RepID=UPI0034646D87